MQGTASAQAAEMQVGRDPVLRPCSPTLCRGCPVDSKPIKLKQGWSQVKAQLLALVQNPLHFSVAPGPSCVGATKEGIGDTGRTGHVTPSLRHISPTRSQAQDPLVMCVVHLGDA